MDRYRMARHEAGHGLLAWVSGHRIRLTVDPAKLATVSEGLGTDAGGHCEILNPRCSDEDQLLVSFGGMIADGDIDGAWHDLVQAVDLAREINTEDPASALQSHYVGAHDILTTPRIDRAVDALARELERDGTIGPKRADKVILKALAKKPRTNAPKR